MRNPNYHYELNKSESGEVNGWRIWTADRSMIAWGKTKAAARSRLLRKLKHNAKVTATQANQEEVNDQS